MGKEKGDVGIGGDEGDERQPVSYPHLSSYPHIPLLFVSLEPRAGPAGLEISRSIRCISGPVLDTFRPGPGRAL